MSFKEEDPEEWSKQLVCKTVFMAMLPMNISDFEEKASLKLGRVTVETDQDDEYEHAFSTLSLGDHKFAIRGPSINDPTKGIVVEVRGSERDPLDLLSAVCSELDLDIDELPWVSEWLTIGSAHAVYRLDDNSNEVEMDRFFNEHCARLYAKEFEKRGHKQTYFVRDLN